MTAWKKLLWRMISDSSPITYTYEQAASILLRLGFELAPTSGGSHRKWRRKLENGAVVVIGLVEKGSGTLKAYLVRDMIQQLRQHQLLPDDLEH